MNLYGKTAKMHLPLQNRDDEFLSNFITQMYQSATMYNMPAKEVKSKDSATAPSSARKEIAHGVVQQQSSYGFPQQNSSGFIIQGEKDTVDDN